MLAVFAHPDDEAFGPGGMLANYGQREDVEIHLLTATRGEAGMWDEESRLKVKGERLKIKNKEEIKIHHIRVEELKESAKVLGIKKVEFLDYVDGTLCNAIYHELAGKITKKMEEFNPDVIVTHDRLGWSGHLDHCAVSMITTYAFLHSTIGKKLYYYCITKEYRDPTDDNYFIYFPEGYDKRDVTTRIEYTPYWDRRIEAMQKHQSQKHDVDSIVKWLKTKPKIDTFILQRYRGITAKFPESDLFEGIISNSD